jgi:hypothetical protein
MTLKYEWKIKSLKKQDDPSTEINDIIVQTTWDCIGTDENGNSGTFNGATPFEPDKVDPNNFTTYSELTEAMIIGWIQGVVNSNLPYKEHIDRQIQKQIDAIAKPVVIVSSDELPWAVQNPPSEETE